MGHKVNPVGLRLGINRTWDSRWFADDQYRDLLIEDLKIREYLHKRLKQAGVSKVVIERPAKKARISIHTARPGVVIGTPEVSRWSSPTSRALRKTFSGMRALFFAIRTGPQGSGATPCRACR
jgi:ribosomal protein S3